MSYERLLSPECPRCKDTILTLTKHEIYRNDKDEFFEGFFCHKTCRKPFYVNVCTGNIFKQINTIILYSA